LIPSLKISVVYLGVSLMHFPATARAEGFGALAIVSSNYSYRGYSKSANHPTARANLDYGHKSGFFVGSWISWVDFADNGYPDRSNVEFYPYVGFNYKLADHWRVETSVARYLYDGRIDGKFSDYNEYSAALHYSDLASVRFDFANDAYNRGAGATNVEITGRYPIFAHWSVSAGLGYNDATPVLEYTTLYWNLGLTWFFKYGALDLRYADAADLADSSKGLTLELPELRQNFIFSLSVGF